MEVDTTDSIPYPNDAKEYSIGLTFLRIHIKSLVAKVRHVRFEEERRGRSAQAKEILRNGRRTALRDNIRSAGLAYAYLKGVGYREVETTTGLGHPSVNWELVRDYVCTYGPRKVREVKRLRVLDDIRAWSEYVPGQGGVVVEFRAA
jgi:hypothetical protein